LIVLGRSRSQGSGAAGRILATLAAVTLAVAGLAGCTSSPSGADSGGHAALVQVDCPSEVVPAVGRRLVFTCYRLAVPVDYGQPDGAQLQLLVMRARLEGQSNRIGALVMNPGGPGASGVGYARQYADTLPLDLLRRFDLVGFDPRGVASSDPVSCLSPQERAIHGGVDAPTDAEYAARVADAEQIGAACHRKYGDRLDSYDTADTARDLDRLREALGEPKLTYLGYSYGTVLGSAYATLFPGHVRALVLDGAVDPVADVVTRTQAQAASAEEIFDAFAIDCVRRHCPLGANPRAFLTRLIAKATAHPVRAYGSKRTADGSAVLAATLAGLYYSSTYWPLLALALHNADHGDAAGVLALNDQWTGRRADGKYTNETDANLVVHCADSAERPTDATVKNALADWRHRYPLFGPFHALQLLSCRGWATPRHPLPKISAGTAPTILVVSARYDPVTPYGGAQQLVRALGHAVLLTWNGHAHTAYPRTDCLNNAVDAYLISGAVPPAGTSCPESR
jgi:pimeloyl-ACP methyl ester carboxylesterase